jgi:hypothetical protein
VRRLLPAALLLAYGAAFALAAFGGGLPAFDDHPGQFFRLWHALERSFPGGHWTADWNPDWWGGYPELQFYPPGFALVGAAIRGLALWQLSVDTVYRLLCAVVLLLPALTVYWLLVRVLDDGWLALPPAFVALTLSAGLRGGVEESVRWGILTPRLSLGLLPLLALSLAPWLETGRPPVWAAALTAAIVLAHPAHAPIALTMLVTAALLAWALRPHRRTLTDGLVVLGFAGALVAFWALPLLVRRSWVVPLAWGEAGVAGLAGELRTRLLLLVIAGGALCAWGAVVARRRPFEAFLAALPLAVLGVTAGDGVLFRRGWSPVEPGRLFDALVLTALVAAGLGLGAAAAALTRRSGTAVRPVGALAAVAALLLLPGAARSEPTLTVWPAARAARWPRLEAVSRAHGLPELWAALRGSPDRVLFVTSSVRLTDDEAWYAPHSHVLALAPLFAGREIVHGTYTHPAPLAARFYGGTPSVPRRLDTLVERLDGHQLLGQPLERLGTDAFEGFARRLRIATVVIPTTDVQRAHFLRDRYAPAASAGGFTVFERRDRPWPQVERITHRRYRVLVSPAGGVWVPTGIPAYPLWRAKSPRGPLETRTDPWGLLEFRVPLDLFEAELVYGEGALEWLALLVSVGGLAGFGLWSWRVRGRPVVAPRVTAGGAARSRTGSGRHRR